MSLRDTNPYIDSDLSLIITTFERSMARNNNESALFVPFRREINGFSGVPRTVIDSISSLPAFQAKPETNDSGPSTVPSIPTPSGALNDDDEALSEQQSPSEDGDDNEEWLNKAKNWVQDCVPCDFRSLTKFDPNFLGDVKGDWEKALGDIDASLSKFDNELLNSDVVFSNVCGLAGQLKPHCIPDLNKIIWLLNFLLSKLNKEIDINLNIFDNLITGILSPIFNAMLSNVDLIDKLALDPIFCVVEQLNATIYKFQNQALGPTVRFSRNPTQEQIANNSRDQREAADVGRQEVLEAARAQQSTQSVSAFLQQARSENEFSVLKDYLETGINYVKNYKKWLTDMLKDIVGSQTESWNSKVDTSKQKLDLLRLIGLVNSIVNAANNGDFICGVDEDSLTAEELKTLIDSYINPNTNLEVSLEDDNLIIRRDRRQDELDQSDGEIQGTDSTSASSSRKIPSNIVLTKPISACLKKVTAEEYNQVQLWIKQLEEDIE